jgi:hypothetical protein
MMVPAPSPAGRPIPPAAPTGPDAPAGRDRSPVAALFAVYQFGWRDRAKAAWIAAASAGPTSGSADRAPPAESHLMPVRTPLRRLHFPRPAGGLAAVPFHALMGWGFGDPDAVVARADVVLAVDVMTRRELLVYGQTALFPVEFAGRAADLSVLAVELDHDSSEVDTLAALVELVKGDHDLPWEIE